MLKRFFSLFMIPTQPPLVRGFHWIRVIKGYSYTLMSSEDSGIGHTAVMLKPDRSATGRVWVNIMNVPEK